MNGPGFQGTSNENDQEMFDHESGSQEAEEILEDEDEQMVDVSEMVDKLVAPVES